MRFRLAVPVLILALVVFSAAQKRKPGARPAAAEALESTICFRVTFGYLRTAEKSYDGSLRVTGGKLIKATPWRFFQSDAMTGAASWKLDIKRVVFENQPDQPNPVASNSASARNLVPAGLVVTVERSSNAVEFQTRQGSFSVPVRQLAYGRISRYLDGDAVVERVPAAFRVSESAKEEQDYPSLAVTRTGAVWTAWQAYQDRGDHVYARRAGGSATRLTEEKGDIYRTAVGEDERGQIHVVWSERNDQDWNLYERVYDGATWGPRRQITREHSPNMFHKLVSGPGGPLRLVWVGYDGGQSYLYLAAFEGGNWSEPQRIGGPSVWSPDAAADRDGNLYVAWDSYQKGNYDIFFRRIAASGEAGGVEQVTTSARFQAHASVTVDGQGRPWLAWDESGVNWGKDWTHEDPYRSTVLYADREIRAVVKDRGEWKEAGDFRSAVPERLRRYWQLPHLAADGNGRVWAAFQMRTSALNNRSDYWCNGGLWDLYLTTFENGAWRPAAFVPNSTSRNEAPFQAVGAADRLWLTWATDGREFGHVPPGYQGATMVHYEVYQAQASQPPQGGAAETPGLRAFTDVKVGAQIMHPNEAQDVARIRAYRTAVNGTTYRILRGDFHRHTDISADGSGDGSLEDYYRYVLDVAEMDTGIVTDHNMGGDVEYNWWRTEKSYDLFRIRGRYTPLFGYERSVNYPNGHRNVVFDHRGVRTLPVGAAENRGEVNSGGILYPYLRQNRGICMEHSLATGQGTDYRDNDPALEPLVEIYQGYHASYEYKGAPRAEDDTQHLLIHGTYEPAGFWWNALAKGLKLGVEASSDHISTHTSYTLIYTPDEQRGRIVESMRSRHAYAATDNIILDFEAQEAGGARHLMGEAFAASGRVKLTARISGTDQLLKVDLVRNNEFVYTKNPGSRQFEFEYVDQAPRPGENYYYVRVIQLDHNLAWSSPIWVRYQ
ncbi:MAG TPA: hypothetical protein VFA33_15240 [Bryobacteraceae bacterium]|nr:hypothetical protein [Bryobacteraceae bacterium]